MERVSVTKLEQYENGWRFTVSGTEWNDGLYRTNMSGEGLFRAVSNDWKQVQGCTQFRLSSNRKTAYGQIRRYFEED